MNMLRTRAESRNRNDSSRSASFTFRRIQSRELYQPVTETDGAAGRLRFRFRLQQNCEPIK